MKTIVLIFCSFFFVLVLSAQEVILDGDLNKSIIDKKTMEKMYQNKWYIEQIKVKINAAKPHVFDEDYYNLAVSYASEEQADSTYFYLLKCIRHSHNFNDLILTNTDFEFLYQSKYWEKIVQQADSVYLTINPDIINKELSVELYHIFLKDQHARGLGLKRNDISQIKPDCENLLRVEEIIEQYGWPTFSMVGKVAAQGAFMVIQYSNIITQRRYFHQLVNAVKNGEASKESLALLADRISVHLTGMQVYGTQVFQVKDSITGKPGKYTYFPIRDEAKVDSLRKSMDLIPLKQYYAPFGIDYKGEM